MTVQIPIDADEIAGFCRRRHIRKLALFGSVLRDDFNPSSDVDVLVEFEAAHVPGFGSVEIQEELADLFGRRVGLNTPGFVSGYIRDRVQREARVLYDADR